MLEGGSVPVEVMYKIVLAKLLLSVNGVHSAASLRRTLSSFRGSIVDAQLENLLIAWSKPVLIGVT